MNLYFYFFAVSLECVNVCNSWRGDGNGRYDCNHLSCASKAPRVLTGFLASTAHPHQYFLLNGRNGRRNQFNFVSFCSFLGIFGISYFATLVSAFDFYLNKYYTISEAEKLGQIIMTRIMLISV